MSTFSPFIVAYKHDYSYICNINTSKKMNDIQTRQVELIKASLKNLPKEAREKQELAEKDLKQARSNSYYTEQQIELMEQLAEVLRISISDVRREALTLFLNHLETGKHIYTPGEVSNIKHVLKNSLLKKSTIAKANRIAGVFETTSAQLRRDALYYFEKRVKDGSYKMYKEGTEFLGNIQNEEPEPYGKN